MLLYFSLISKCICFIQYYYWYLFVLLVVPHTSWIVYWWNTLLCFSSQREILTCTSSLYFVSIWLTITGSTTSATNSSTNTIILQLLLLYPTRFPCLPLYIVMCMSILFSYIFHVYGSSVGTSAAGHRICYPPPLMVAPDAKYLSFDFGVSWSSIGKGKNSQITLSIG